MSNFRTQTAVKNVWWFMDEAIHAFSHHVEFLETKSDRNNRNSTAKADYDASC